MKIEKISLKKNGQYEIMLSDKTSLSFYDDTIIKYNLLKPQNINSKLLEEIILFNDEVKAFNIALKYITAKLRTKKEIEKKLKDFDQKVIYKVILKLEKLGYLNDELYIKSFVNDQINLTLNGPKKIIRKLSDLGFKEEKAKEFIDSFTDAVWEEKILKIINKKIKSNHKLSNIMLKNKIKKDLILEGFNKSMIEKALDESIIYDDSKIIAKEFNKELNRLKRKYDGNALITKIRINMYKKGFSLTEIDRLIRDNID